eukprot:Skav217208  [mRNA]  locus=scaffold143:135509:138109:- [translate_table: standard]
MNSRGCPETSLSVDPGTASAASAAATSGSTPPNRCLAREDEILSPSSAKPREDESTYLDTASTVEDSLRPGPYGHLAANMALGEAARWAPPAPHLLPPLPPMSYELRCWIQALERAQNPSVSRRPNSTGSLKDSIEGSQPEAATEVIAKLQKEAGGFVAMPTYLFCPLSQRP